MKQNTFNSRFLIRIAPLNAWCDVSLVAMVVVVSLVIVVVVILVVVVVVV